MATYNLINGESSAVLKTFPDNFIARFKTKYTIDPITGCWNWHGSKDKEGYGVFWDNEHGNNRRAHRVSMEINGTPIPEHLQSLHRCDNKGCVNPEHIRAGTNRENQQEARDRGLIGDLTEKRKAKIRSMNNEEFEVWKERFAGKTGKAESNLITALNWRAK